MWLLCENSYQRTTALFIQSELRLFPASPSYLVLEQVSWDVDEEGHRERGLLLYKILWSALSFYCMGDAFFFCIFLMMHYFKSSLEKQLGDLLEFYVTHQHTETVWCYVEICHFFTV